MDEFKQRIRDLDVSMGIGETSRVTGATPTQIRYWEKKGIVHSMRHGQGQNKRYTYRDIATIMLIKTQIDEGYTLAKAKSVAAQHFSLVEAVQRIFKERLTDSEQVGDSMLFNFGPLANDPEFDVEAKVGKTIEFLKVPHKKDNLEDQ